MVTSRKIDFEGQIRPRIDSARCGVPKRIYIGTERERERKRRERERERERERRRNACFRALKFLTDAM